MTPLITMLEQADCGSRELDVEIFRALWPATIGDAVPDEPANDIDTPCLLLRSGDHRFYMNVPPFSTSLDAALSALPEGWEYSITTVYGFVAVELPLNCGDHVPSVRVIRGDCNTALALITAILKATREAGE